MKSRLANYTAGLTLFLFIFSLTLVKTSWAEKPKPSKYPRGCEEVGLTFKDDLLVITPNNESNNQGVVLLHNSSVSNLELEYYNPKFPNFGTWSNKIKANRWSSFAVDKLMHFRCNKLSSKGSTHVNCQEVLEGCQYPRAKTPLHMLGTYWIINDVYSRSSVVSQTIRSGILLRW